MSQKQFQKISKNAEISIDYITCVEYQVFIDEKLTLGAYYQPDHWKTNRFPYGDANKPITGVRASDTEAFCEWLSQKYPLPGYRYRLPSLAELEQNPSSEVQIGCWCMEDINKRVIGGIDSEQWQIWQQKLANFCNTNIHRDLGKKLKLDLDLVSVCDLNLNFEFSSPNVHLQMLSLAQDLTFVFISELSLIKARSPRNYSRVHSKDWVIFLNRIFTIVVRGLRILMGFLFDIFAPAAKGIRKMMNFLFDIFISAFEYVRDIFTSAFDYVRDIFTSAFEYVRDIFTSAFEYVRDLIFAPKRNYNNNHKTNRSLDFSPEQILEEALTRSSDFDRALNRVYSRQRERSRRTRISPRVRSDQEDNLTSDFDRALAQLHSRELERIHLLRSRIQGYIQNRIFNFIETFDFDLNCALDFNYNLDLAFARTLDRAFNYEKRNFPLIRHYLLTASMFFAMLSNDCAEESKRRELSKYKNLTSQECKDLSNNYGLKRNKFFNLYVFFLLLDERREGSMPAWEGIRIVRERIED
jgi:hypothetical protein